MLPQSYQYRNLSEGVDRVGGQLRGDKECPFSGVTRSGSVWRKVPESNARSVFAQMDDVHLLTMHSDICLRWERRGVELQKGWMGVSFAMTVYVQYGSGMV